MGLAASQTRFLSLTARKSDLEYQAQTINTRRIQLAEKSSEAARTYAQGSANTAIRINQGAVNGDPSWELLTFNNLLKSGYRLTGPNGTELIPSPYKEKITTLTPEQYEELPEAQRSGFVYSGTYTKTETTTLTSEQYSALEEAERDGFTQAEDGKYVKTQTTTLSSEEYSKLKTAERDGYIPVNDGTYTKIETIVDPEYKGEDIQTLLMNGRAQIVTGAFFDYLMEHGYDTGAYMLDGKAASYAQIVDEWEADPTKVGIDTIVAYGSDITSMFKEDNYTEDDAQVYRDYEVTTDEIQAQDKQLELELKRIETEHKAVETEMESVKKSNR